MIESADGGDRPVPHTAVVLAGDRGPSDPVAVATGAPCKALAPVGGQALLARVIEILRGVARIDAIVVVGPARTIVDSVPTLKALLAAADVTWVAPADSPSASAARGLDTLAPGKPALLTTADHALLTAAMIEPLLDTSGCDLSVGLVDYARVRRAYPASRRTAIRLGRDDGYCGCNLFAVHTSAARKLIADWQRVEKQRKHPARVVASMLGWTGVLRYALHRLDLEDAFARLSRRAGMQVCPVPLSEPEAGIDVDSLSDLQLVESILTDRKRTRDASLP
ncbi:hypothetical protein T5B8_08929 [Salinisphaera sp. T5B8]|uniref:nucleotidyltransferase family protein n=1 Tax=Salinisphaera sp. T5B8 TaxID=1304154 RepID=UPI00333FC53B